MGLEEFFTNEGQKADEKTEVKAPAFSLTKVQGALGGLIAVALGVVPQALEEDETIIVAAIAAGTLILLGVFALAAVDIRTRQKARAAALRYGEGKQVETKLVAMPTRDLILQEGHNKDEFEITHAVVENGSVHVYARNGGEQSVATFKESPKPK